MIKFDDDDIQKKFNECHFRRYCDRYSIICNNFSIRRFKMSEWITDRQPDKSGTYLCVVKTAKCLNVYFHWILSYATDLYEVDKFDFQKYRYKKKTDRAGWYDLDSEYGYIRFEDDEVVAWMELPELPEQYKGEEENDNAPTIEPNFGVFKSICCEDCDKNKRTKDKWIMNEEWSDWECPHCGHAFEHRMNFCGYCGADMRGKEE